MRRRWRGRCLPLDDPAADALDVVRERIHPPVAVAPRPPEGAPRAAAAAHRLHNRPRGRRCSPGRALAPLAPPQAARGRRAESGAPSGAGGSWRRRETGLRMACLVNGAVGGTLLWERRLTHGDPLPLDALDRHGDEAPVSGVFQQLREPLVVGCDHKGRAASPSPRLHHEFKACGFGTVDEFPCPVQKAEARAAVTAGR